ncbi:MAG TPA: macro domain-containing protein [Trichocoleus sp.]
MQIYTLEGDLLDQPVEVIVNAWNRNIIPWWLLLPQGVSGAIKRRAGLQPFREVARHGAIPLGGAVLTSAGRLPFHGIIHVAGINMFWRSSEFSVRRSVRSAMRLVIEHHFHSVAFPLIGAGSGGGSPDHIQTLITEELSAIPFDGKVYVVRFAKPRNIATDFKQ